MSSSAKVFDDVDQPNNENLHKQKLTMSQGRARGTHECTDVRRISLTLGRAIVLEGLNARYTIDPGIARVSILGRTEQDSTYRDETTAPR